MLRLGQLVMDNRDQLTELQTTESAVPRQFASKSPGCVADYLAYNAGWIDKIGGDVIPSWPRASLDYSLDEPYGVVAIIIPWNAPLIALGQLLGPALAAGNTVVVKPSELASYTALRVGELIIEAGFPPGTVNVVPGDSEGGEATRSPPRRRQDPLHRQCDRRRGRSWRAPSITLAPWVSSLAESRRSWSLPTPTWEPPRGRP